MNKVGVVGSGTMGNGIAHVFAIYEYNVTLVDISQKILDDAINKIRSNINRQIKKNIISDNDAVIALKNIDTTTNLELLSDCDLVIEAVKEDLDIKVEIFKKLDSICSDKTIFASNTSSISINTLGSYLKNPEKFIGMHFMNPVPVMKLVEIINGDKTSQETKDLINNISKSLDKIPIECNDAPGFVSNRILMPMINEAAFCYMDGVAKPEAIDSIMQLGMGHPMGPLKLADLIGIDVCVYIMNVLYEGFKNEKYRVCPILLDMMKAGKLGKKTKEGFYKYEF
tara:strand:+ start:574 stop:1422 length:849 start_codon:yes stop_codon:yes gene_type:complete